MSTQPTHLAGDQYVQATGMEDLWNVWYSELNNGVAGLTVKVNRIIESTESPFQRIDVLDTKQYGKILVLYGSLMVAEKDNNAYNEMISHVPLFAHPNPKKVLIIGGGDCGALTEVLKHPGVEQCTMCEIDKLVVDEAVSDKDGWSMNAAGLKPAQKSYVEVGDRHLFVLARRINAKLIVTRDGKILSGVGKLTPYECSDPVEFVRVNHSAR